MSASESFSAAKPSELVRFALAWAPFEDPVEEIFVTFGISSSVFYERVLEVLTAGGVQLDVGRSAALVQHCRDRLRRKVFDDGRARSVA
ncbi:hypothetical protein CYJ73_15395 [Gordonia terrae]|uniref:DUF3263 domain-containing protein n=2 Tax=Gordonia TaxID=2053 RepID=A0A2I1R5Y4_9ACTN|nr:MULTISPECIES: hypothetical protein [Gordonia]PKZ64547.1 hypothetical protein CYJ73_15395 [Gordonia terrae]UPW10086.1 hypothetical protein M1C59_04320 [Gordonia terrae]SDU79485.1 hypothetical protein SAMN04488548_136222 [Gordonia westfalica]